MNPQGPYSYGSTCIEQCGRRNIAWNQGREKLEVAILERSFPPTNISVLKLSEREMAQIFRIAPALTLIFH
jgi:hypothetical protein